MPLRVSRPGPVLCLVSFGAGRPGPFVPLPGSVLRAPSWTGLCVRGGPGPGGCGGGGSLAAPLGGPAGSGSFGGSRGAGGWGLLCLGPSLCLPCTGTKAGFFRVAQSMEGVVSILLRFLSVRSHLSAA